MGSRLACFKPCEGELFYNETEARVAYDNVNASWAKRLYDPAKSVVDDYGSLLGQEWCQLETWASEAQCSGEAPALLKQMRSRIPINPAMHTRSHVKGNEIIFDSMN